MVAVVCVIAESQQAFRGDLVRSLAKVIGQGPPCNRAFFEPVGSGAECAAFASHILFEEGAACKVSILMRLTDGDLLAMRLGFEFATSTECSKLLELWESCMIV